MARMAASTGSKFLSCVQEHGYISARGWCHVCLNSFITGGRFFSLSFFVVLGFFFPTSADILRECRPQVCNAAMNFYDSMAADVQHLNSFSDATILINSIQGLFTLLPKCFPIWHYGVECWILRLEKMITYDGFITNTDELNELTIQKFVHK